MAITFPQGIREDVTFVIHRTISKATVPIDRVILIIGEPCRITPGTPQCIQQGKSQKADPVGRGLAQGNEWPDDNEISVRTGQIREINDYWDDGFYTNASIGDTSVYLLIDTDSTTSLLAVNCFIKLQYDIDFIKQIS